MSTSSDKPSMSRKEPVISDAPVVPGKSLKGLIFAFRPSLPCEVEFLIMAHQGSGRRSPVTTPGSSQQPRIAAGVIVVGPELRPCSSVSFSSHYKSLRPRFTFNLPHSFDRRLMEDRSRSRDCLEIGVPCQGRRHLLQQRFSFMSLSPIAPMCTAPFFNRFRVVPTISASGQIKLEV
ncbi:hypothetical protein ACJRO7_005083 [Eucalyptus globulus]|uniref:Uncharacterized protein n=1 Tax=Eucalyptus globulus TaxID=34317 RepID=A0ABD3IYG8_EUCGL